ncbi:MAG TPA: hypothetical protein VK778_06980 [Solirubrobacteraceae bacterium]|jgi:hypothetical protein|nr:hypothetical protein [Solirubrobacteraceae bacterium]
MSGRNSLYRRLGAAVATALVGVGAGMYATLPAQATTGNADGLPEPKVLVNPAIGDAYIGRFYLSRIERRAGLVSAVLDIDYTESVEHEFMVGDGEFYQYDKRGELTSWTASLYPFEYRNGVMTCNLLVPGTTTQVLGRLVLDKPSDLDTPAHPNQEKLNGTLTVGGTSYSASFRQVEDDLPAPTVLPRAAQVGAAPTASPEAPAAVRQESSAAAPNANADAGVYASVVALVKALS